MEKEIIQAELLKERELIEMEIRQLDKRALVKYELNKYKNGNKSTIKSICYKCKHSGVINEINKLFCNKYDLIITGVTLNCPNGFEKLK